MGGLVHDEDDIDDDIEEGLAEDHQHDECRKEYAAGEVEAKLRAAQLRAQHEWVPTDSMLKYILI